MSTRSYICKENKDGTYTGIYCHSDGYLTYNGAMLLDHYKDRGKVEKLIGYGDMSVLYENVDPEPDKPHSFDYGKRQDNVCVFYGRDRGETNCEPREVDLKELDGPESWIAYCYIFGLDNKWKYFECGRLNEGLRDVEEDLNLEYKKLGFPRPKGYYGFYTDEEIAEQLKLNSKESEMS